MADPTIPNTVLQSCPEEKLVRGFERGELSTQDMERVAEHVASCSSCEELYVRLAQGRPHHMPIELVADARQLQDESSFVAFTERMNNLVMNGACYSVSDSERQGAGYGRYIIQKKLGEGSFGTVYLAEDPLLGRSVALKVSRWTDSNRSKGIFAREAKNAAQLRDPSLVSIFDIGWEADGRCYLVLEYIDGCDLSTLLRNESLSVADLLTLSVGLATALGALHGHGLLHRDLKPANVLVDRNRAVKITDFGLSVYDSYRQTLPDAFAGTLDYMAPEQVRGEAHRFDARTDIWGFGVILYLMFTGSKPFSGDAKSSVRDSIEYVEPNLPSELVSSLPKSLDRIIMRCLAKRMSKRYSSMAEVIEDLEVAISSDTPESSRKVFSRGLQPYTAKDHQEYLLLTPGLRDKDGLPESISNWKRRIEDPNGFSVGVLMGPSGVGKSSFFQAGLLPALNPAITAIYLRLDANWTENHIAEALKAEFTELEPSYDCRKCLLQMRHRTPLLPSGKSLIVLDQFEQFLSSEEKWPSLANALRQCDGKHIAVMLGVRDDYFLALSRFMSILDIELQTESNFGTIDLFEIEHAKQVLCSFGAAIGKCKDTYNNCSKSERSFIDYAIMQLAVNDRVSPLHLALFCYMTARVEWSVHAMQRFDLRNIGVSYLEASIPATGVANRCQRQTCVNILRTLLPDSVLADKVCSLSDLASATQLEKNSEELTNALNYLANDLRLIVRLNVESNIQDNDKTRYRLTHDFVIQPIREWVEAEQLTTKSGRAFHLLKARGSAWHREQHVRQLPSLLEYISMLWQTNRRQWQIHESAMMRSAASYYSLRIIAALAIMTLTFYGVYTAIGGLSRTFMLEGLKVGNVAKAIEVIEGTDFTENELKREFDRIPNDAPISERLNLSIALVDQASQNLNNVLYLLLDEHVPWSDFEQVLQFLKRRGSGYDLATIAAIANQGKQPDLSSEQDSIDRASRRLRAAMILWGLGSQSEMGRLQWNEVSDVLARALVANVESNPDSLSVLARLVMNGNEWLYSPLFETFKDNQNVSAQFWATELLEVLTRDSVDKRTELLFAANPYQFKRLMSDIASRDEFSDRCEQFASTESNAPLGRANAILAVCYLGNPDFAWKYFKHSPDPTLRSFLIDRISLGFATPVGLINRLDIEQDVEIKRALALALGRYCDEPQLPDTQSAIAMKVSEIQSSSNDSGLTSACGWTLQKLNANNIDFEPSTDYLRNGQISRAGHVFVRIQGPQYYTMGSPETEAERYGEEERLSEQEIKYSFCISIAEVTKNQYWRCNSASPRSDFAEPKGLMTWQQAAHYCNWLTRSQGMADSELCYEEHQPGKYREYPDSLQRHGFRLPTSVEWEYVCRAGAKTSRYYGEDKSLLFRYAHLDHENEQVNPCGKLLPNDLGVFDMLGNLSELCHDRYDVSTDRVLRGGSYYFTTKRVRNASVGRISETQPLYDIGFRIAQTVD